MKVVDKIYNLIKSVEESLSDDAVVIKNIKRSMQLDRYSCGAQCAFMILQYFGKDDSIDNVKKELNVSKTDGVDTEPILDLFKKKGLNVRVNENAKLNDIRNAIDNNWPMLISINDGDHWVVVYGYSENFIWVLDPAIKRIRCKIRTDKFMTRWDEDWVAEVRL